MKRGIAAIVVLVAVVIAVVSVRHHQDATTQRVDVVFDTAKGMVAGQLVKIAGARAGRVQAVHLTPQHRARMQLRIEDRFMPFHSDANCRILPEGPISENYVECDPGVKASQPLPVVSGVPTVPVTQTTAPVSIQDLLNVFAAPTQVRLRLLINELGIGTAGRGEDINDILRRANPALRQASSLLKVVNGQRAELGRAIDQTDTVLAGLSAGDNDVRRFVSAAAATARTTGAHRTALSQAIDRLPSMLSTARSGLRAIDRATAAGTPLLSSLRQAGPELTAVTKNLPAFAKAAVPAVRSTTAASIQGRSTVKSAKALGHSLKSLGATKPVIDNLRDFMVASRDKGAIEYLLRVPYALANLSALYNGVSHVVTLYAGVQAQCLLEPAITVPGCDQQYFGPRTPVNAPENLGVTRRLIKNALAKLDARKKSKSSRPAGKPAKGNPSTALAPVTKPLAPVATGVQQLLGGIGALIKPPPVAKGDKGIAGLLDYLLK